jgi:hypothetical protein
MPAAKRPTHSHSLGRGLELILKGVGTLTRKQKFHYLGKPSLLLQLSLRTTKRVATAQPGGCQLREPFAWPE